MADYLIQESTLDAIVRAINDKAGTQVTMTPAQMVTAIGNIQTGGSGLNWQVINAVGTDSTSITYNITRDTSKSCLAVLESNVQGNIYTPEIVSYIIYFHPVITNSFIGTAEGMPRFGVDVKLCYDTANITRTPSVTIGNSSIQFTVTKDFSSEVTYRLHYVEFDIG